MTHFIAIGIAGIITTLFIPTLAGTDGTAGIMTPTLIWAGIHLITIPFTALGGIIVCTVMALMGTVMVHPIMVVMVMAIIQFIVTIVIEIKTITKHIDVD